MMELVLGLKGHAEVLVTDENTAAAVGSGCLPVYSTPHMIALMEGASMDAIKDCLEEGQGSVGINLNVEHLAATPRGVLVRAESELIEIDRRMLNFKVEAYAGDELIGRGTHKRCLVFNERFMEKVMAKAK